MTRNQKAGLLVGAGVFSLLPIWRAAGGWRGMNLFQYANTCLFRGLEAIPHIPVEEAIVKAHEAYCEVTDGQVTDSGAGVRIPANLAGRV